MAAGATVVQLQCRCAPADIVRCPEGRFRVASTFGCPLHPRTPFEFLVSLASSWSKFVQEPWIEMTIRLIRQSFPQHNILKVSYFLSLRLSTYKYAKKYLIAGIVSQHQALVEFRLAKLVYRFIIILSNVR